MSDDDRSGHEAQRQEEGEREQGVRTEDSEDLSSPQLTTERDEADED
jgi:hypothetical protein